MRALTADRAVLISSVFLAAAASGCLDLDLPTAPDGGVAPSLRVVIPQAGDTLTLNSLVSVAAASVAGDPTVTLSCLPPDGGTQQAVQVYAWPGPPYTALVDLTRCEKLAGAGSDGGIGSMVLHSEAFTTGGPHARADVAVNLDATAASLLVDFPPTVQPLSRFEVTVTPVDQTRPLSAYPEVALEGTPADTVTQELLPDGGVTYRSVFRSTPGLGIDRYLGPLPAPATGLPAIPIEVLTETARAVLLTVDARAQNGNPTHLSFNVDLSRVVWDVPVPGQPANGGGSNWPAEPVVSLLGLELPLATSTTFGSAWIPGLLGVRDGVFTGFDPVRVGGLDGGYLAEGMNSQGWTLFAQPNGNGSNLLLVPPPGQPGANVAASIGTQLLTPLTAVDDLLCLPDITNIPVGQCLDTAVEGLVCLTPALTTVVAGAVGFTGPPNPGAVAGAGGRYLSPNAATCGAGWNFVDLVARSVTFGPRTDPSGAGRGCVFQSVLRLLPVGDGSFVLQLQSNCGATALVIEYPILLVSSSNVVVNSYVVKFGQPATVQRTVVTALPDARVVTVRNQPPYTVFELWAPGNGQPDAVALVAGLYDYTASSQEPILPRNAVAGEDGSLAVLLTGANLSAAVAAFGPGLQPRWVYLYPHLTQTSSDRLVGGRGIGDVYLVDGTFSPRAVSLRLSPPDAGTVTGGTPDGGTSQPDGGSRTDGGTPDAGVTDAG